jgi:hypothetical protein
LPPLNWRDSKDVLLLMRHRWLPEAAGDIHHGFTRRAIFSAISTRAAGTAKVPAVANSSRYTADTTIVTHAGRWLGEKCGNVIAHSLRGFKSRWRQLPGDNELRPATD